MAWKKLQQTKSKSISQIYCYPPFNYPLAQFGIIQHMHSILEKQNSYLTKLNSTNVYGCCLMRCIKVYSVDNFFYLKTAVKIKVI